MSCLKPVVFSPLLIEGLSMNFWPSVRAVSVYGMLGWDHVLRTCCGSNTDANCMQRHKTYVTSCEE